MIGLYRLPAKAKTHHSEILTITEQSQLKDAIFNKTIQKARILDLKNSNMKEDSLKLLRQIQLMKLPLMEMNLAQNFSFVSDATIEILCSLTNLSELKILNLADNQLTDESLVLLAKSIQFMRLQQLILYGNSDISSEGILILSASKCIINLKKLDVHATSIDDHGISFFLKSENSHQLEDLNVSMSWKNITDKTLYSLGISTFCKSIKILNLEDCAITDIGIDQICESQNSSHLEQLDLNNSIKQKNNHISDKSLSSIAFSKNLINLKVLQLRNTEITPKGLKTLAVSLACQKIQMLRLSYCQLIYNQTLVYLQKIIEYQSLKKIYINATKIEREQFEKFEQKNPQVNLIY